MDDLSEREIARFLDIPLPVPLVPSGYAALIREYTLEAPIPYTLCGIVRNHHPPVDPQFTKGGSVRVGWRLFSPRHYPGATAGDHLTFALKYEGIHLTILAALFCTVDRSVIEALVRATPTGAYSRRVWFLYEWLTGTRLNLPDAARGNYIPAVDPDRQYAVTGTRVSRYRVVNNLPGTPSFCPMITRTGTLQSWSEQALLEKANAVVDRVPQDILSRTAAFLLLKDSRSSYAIEGESPPLSRIERWGRIIGQAGSNPVTIAELNRLQEAVVGGSRFVKPGLRTDGGFVGGHDRETGTPIPEHISARPQDLPDLMRGLTGFIEETAMDLPSLIAATAAAFGFVYIHPFSDGNGRVHRYLLHHVLARKGFGRPGVIFPVSAAFLSRIDEYRAILQSWSHRLLPLIIWEETEDHNVRVKNGTSLLYRYPELTPHAEFVASCIVQTIEEDLPRETAFLQAYEAFRRGVTTIIDMPDRTIHTLFRFLDSNGGLLPKRRRRGEFADLTDEQLARILRLYVRHMQ